MAMNKSEEQQTKSYVEKVAEKIIASLNNGTAPWIRPWKASELATVRPINPISKARYKGINLLNLLIEAQERGYNDNRWLTYKQAKSLGAQVRTGEKGTTIQYWKFSEVVDKTDEEGNKVFDDNGNSIKVTVPLEHAEVFFSTVFNAQQIDGMPEIVFEKPLEDGFDAIEMAEKIIHGSGAVIHHVEQGRAFYRPSTDDITLPLKEQFESEMGYYSIALHELGHWTGHESRLDRDLKNLFGTPEYAKEELRAEIASYMLCSDLSLDYDPGNHISYIASWVKILQDKPNEVFKAAADAVKITQFLTKDCLEIKIDEEKSKSVTNNSTETKQKVYYDVSFKQKNEAKQLGAKWDKDLKMWYAEDDDIKKMDNRFKRIGDEAEKSPLDIYFKRAEGPSHLCVAKTFTNFEDVNKYMGEMSKTAPKEGYDKCDFKVDFGNGDTYTGRYDLKHSSIEKPDLANYVKEELLFYAGELKPDHMSQSQYDELLHMYGNKEEAADMLLRVGPALGYTNSKMDEIVSIAASVDSKQTLDEALSMLNKHQNQAQALKG